MIASPPQNKPVVIDFTSGFNPNLLFSRASTAIRTNKNGNLESVLSGIPRIDFNAITGESRGVLIEPQSTNIVRYSSDFSSSAWSKTGSVVELSSVIAPTGDFFQKLRETTDSGSHKVEQATAMAVSQYHTMSVIAKSAERSVIRLVYRSSTAWSIAPSATFNLQAGTCTLSTGVAARIEYLGDGAYLCSVTGVTSDTATGSRGMLISIVKDGATSYLGDGTSGVYIAAAQFEESARASSRISTASAQVTRAADSLSIQGAVFNRFFTQSEGAIYIEFEHDRASWPAPTPAILCLSDGSGTGETSGIVLSASAAGTSLDVSSSDVSQASMLVSNGSAAGVHRAAFSYKADSFSLSVDNATPSIDTTGTIPTLSRLDIGSVIGARHFSGWIKRIAIFPRAASSAIIQSITQ